MIAKVNSVNGASGNSLEIALRMHLRRELTKDPQIVLDSIGEMVAIFLLENKKKSRVVKLRKLD